MDVRVRFAIHSAANRVRIERLQCTKFIGFRLGLDVSMSFAFRDGNLLWSSFQSIYSPRPMPSWQISSLALLKDGANWFVDRWPQNGILQMAHLHSMRCMSSITCVARLLGLACAGECVCVCGPTSHGIMAPAFIRTIAFPANIDTFEHIDYCDGVAECGRGLSD